MPACEAKLQGQVRGGVAWLQEQGVDTSGIESYKVFDAGAIMRYTARVLNSLSGALTNGFMILMIVIFMLMEASSILQDCPTSADVRSYSTSISFS